MSYESENLGPRAVFDGEKGAVFDGALVLPILLIFNFVGFPRDKYAVINYFDIL